MHENGIDTIVIKGVSAAKHYPKDQLRDSIDVDLAVDPGVFRKALSIAKANVGLGLAIDLHRGLRAFSDHRWNDLLDQSEMLDLSGSNVRVLRPELNLRVLCHHWLLDGGRDRSRLLDLKYLIEDTKDRFDWDRFFDDLPSSSSFNYQCAIGLAAREFGIDLSSTPLATAEENVPSWLCQFVVSEWKRDFKHLPLESSIIVKGKTTEQLLDRFRPNPIRAIIEMNGRLDTKHRKIYQAANFFYRIPSTVSRVGWVTYHEWRLRKNKRS